VHPSAFLANNHHPIIFNTDISSTDGRKRFAHYKSLANSRHNIVWLQQRHRDYWYVQL
jgi:hypothetical protein